jgi:tetratricopeptide (TPR) repeat protein
MMLALAASLGYAWWGQQQALHEGQRALRMQTFLYRLFKMANSNITGKPAATLPEFLQLGVKVLPEYIKNPADLRHAQLALAESMFFSRDYADADRVYAQVTESATTAGDAASEAEAQAYAGNIALQQGRTDAALVRTARGLAASRRPGVSPRTRALSAVEYALVREDMGQRTEEDVRLMEFAVKESVDHGLPAHEIGEALYYLGAVLSLRGRLEESQRRFEEALHAYSQDALALCDQVLVLDGLAALRENQARFEDSVLLYDRAYRASTTCAGAGDLQTLRIGAYMAGALIRTGRAAESLRILERELPVVRKALPPRSVFLYEILSPLALAYIETGRYQDAEKAATELLGSFDMQIPANDKRFGTTQFLLARSLAGQGRYHEALAHAEAAEHILSDTPPTPFNQKAAGEARSTLAQIREKVRNQ